MQTNPISPINFVRLESVDTVETNDGHLTKFYDLTKTKFLLKLFCQTKVTG